MRGDPYAEDASRPHDLMIHQFGEEQCQPEHAFGPHVREHYLIHFVVSGSGVLQCGGRVHPVSAGQGFLILPGEVTRYQADALTPWHYAWVGYQGTQAKAITRAAGLDEMHRVFTATHPEKAWQALSQMREDAKELRLLQMSAVGSLLRFLSLIAPEQTAGADTPARQYCEKAQWYLEGRYDRDVSIREAADFVGLSRSQLYRVMMQELGCSPKGAPAADPHAPCPSAAHRHASDAGEHRPSDRSADGCAIRRGVQGLLRHQPRCIQACR